MMAVSKVVKLVGRLEAKVEALGKLAKQVKPAAVSGGGSGGKKYWTCVGCKDDRCFDSRHDCHKCGMARPQTPGSPAAAKAAAAAAVAKAAKAQVQQPPGLSAEEVLAAAEAAPMETEVVPIAEQIVKLEAECMAGLEA